MRASSAEGRLRGDRPRRSRKPSRMLPTRLEPCAKHACCGSGFQRPRWTDAEIAAAVAGRGRAPNRGARVRRGAVEAAPAGAAATGAERLRHRVRLRALRVEGPVVTIRAPLEEVADDVVQPERVRPIRADLRMARVSVVEVLLPHGPTL